MSTRYSTLKSLLLDPVEYMRVTGGVRLRSYQEAVARAVIDSVLRERGLSFVVMFPRQSGKNELQAQIEAYLLALLAFHPAEIVKVSPTWKPQSINAMRRLERVLDRSPMTAGVWEKENGYAFRVGSARMFFLSGSPEANIVGATASTLLEVDEAQDVTVPKFDRDVAPMAASTNATRVFWGTAWTANTLLARELRAARAAERRDGVRRAFVLTADDVAHEVPQYAAYVAGQVARFGRDHPLVRTQYFSEEIDSAGGMFPPERIARMIDPAYHPAPLPQRGVTYAFLLDVAGEDGSASGAVWIQPSLIERQPGSASRDRDSTALTIVEVDRSTLADPLLRAPTYRTAARRGWQGASQAQLFADLRALVDSWQPRWIVVDATGIGAGLASFLARAYPTRVHPFTFTQSSKSKLGWDFLTLVDGGRWKEQSLTSNPLTSHFFTQLSHTTCEVIPGPGRVMRWGVPDGTRDRATGQYVHDDWVMSAALAAVLDELPWSAAVSAPTIVRARDPLDDMNKF